MCFLLPAAALAVDEEISDFEELDLESLLDTVYSAAKHQQEIGESPSGITVISREDIEASGANTMADLLRLVPGMDVVVSSAFFTSVTSRLNWNTENQYYLVLVDGREANVELLGRPFWELEPISLEDIERIEVIRGPGSALYGANAVAGVISITTRGVPKKTSARVSMHAGEIGVTILGAKASTRIGPWGFSVNGGADLMGSFSDPSTSEKRVWKFRTFVEYRLSNTRRFLLDLGISEATGVLPTASGMVDGTMGFRTLRLAYEGEDLQGQLYWFQLPTSVKMTAPLALGGVTLAKFLPAETDGHTVDGQVQWTLPAFWEPVLVIVGGGARVTWVGSDDLLDAETYADISSPDYHESGISHWESRVGGFVHTEFKPADFVTITGDLRFDYNSETEEFLSFRLASVFKPAAGQYIRLGVARAFRKPSFLEMGTHAMVDFPADSPITGPEQERFLEFMTRVIGNSNLTNERLLSIEAGYLGQFLDRRLSVSLDLYCNIHTNRTYLYPNLILDMNGLPDLDLSTFMMENRGTDLRVIGSELSVTFRLSRHISLLASWTHREVFRHDDKFVPEKQEDNTPKNLITVGGRFRTNWGLIGSLYIFSRSKFTDWGVENPEGILEPRQKMRLPNVFLLLGKIGWKWAPLEGLELETGLKLFLPVSPSSGYLFGYHEKGGGTTIRGVKYGGDELLRIVTGYLQGSF
ncbi:TonB-dependent receptor plug domain-containing protein [Myxococcota bacterium]